MCTAGEILIFLFGSQLGTFTWKTKRVVGLSCLQIILFVIAVQLLKYILCISFRARNVDNIKLSWYGFGLLRGIVVNVIHHDNCCFASFTIFLQMGQTVTSRTLVRYLFFIQVFLWDSDVWFLGYIYIFLLVSSFLFLTLIMRLIGLYVEK